MPQTVRKRNYIFDTIREVYELFGYEPIETPAMENLETLTGKYGEEGDRLIFKILRRDQKLEKALEGLYDSPKYSGAAVGRKTAETELSDFALRYDLTVPFARFVVMHQNELTFPFRRYQIQPVWRADRPQRGRYREFYQCDADIVGTDSLRCEAEFVQIIDEVFTRLNIPVRIKLNNRKILAAMARFAGVEDRLTAMTVAIDKLDKMPREQVLADLAKQGFTEKELKAISELLDVAAQSNDDVLSLLEARVGGVQDGRKGFEEMREVFDLVGSLQSAELRFDASLARGLNYYTGTIIEVVPLTKQSVGSVCGGGRYDDLTGIFGMPGVSGVGISFGADRIYDILETENGFPAGRTVGTKLLFANLGSGPASRCDEILPHIRKAGISAELYPDEAKMKKQMKYANDKNIPFVALIGENELKTHTITLKDMETGEQFAVGLEELIAKLQENNLK